MHEYKICDILDAAKASIDDADENPKGEDRKSESSKYDIATIVDAEAADLEWTITNISRYIEDLLELEDVFLSAAQDEEENASISERAAALGSHEAHDFFVKLIQEQFPAADIALVKRLGRANWTRKQRIQQATELGEEKDEQLVAKSVVTPSQFHDSGLGSSLPIQPSYAISVVSYFTSTGDQTKVQLPRLSDEAREGKPFRCDGCGSEIIIEDEFKWK